MAATGLDVINPTNSFAEAAHRAFHEELQKSADDVSFIEELEEFLTVMNNNDVDEE